MAVVWFIKHTVLQGPPALPPPRLQPVLLFVQNIEIPLALQPLWSVGMGVGEGRGQG